MSLKNDFFSDMLFETLSLPVTASEEEIQKSFDSLKVRVDRGFMVTEEDKIKILRLEPKLFDTEFRLRSMILKGDFGSDGLDLQLKRLKKLLASKKIVPQEWLDVGASLHVVLRSPEFSELILSTCALTKNLGPNGVTEQTAKLLANAVNSIFQAILDLQVSGAESAFKNFDRITPLEHLSILENFPGIPPDVRQKSFEEMLELFWKPAQIKMGEIKNLKASLASEKSEYNVKVLASRIEQEAKEGLIPVFDLYSSHSFKNQKKYLDELRVVLDVAIIILKECHKPEKADFFVAKLSGQDPKKKSSPQTTFPLKGKKSSETQAFKPPTEKNKAIEKKSDSGVPTENAQEFLKRVKGLSESGNLEKAHQLLLQEIRKTKDNDKKSILETASQDPLYLLNSNVKNPSSSSFFPLKKEAKELCPGYSILIQWLALGKSLPLFALKAFVVKTSSNDFVGQIPMPPLKHGAQFILTAILFISLLGSLVGAILFLSPNTQKSAEESFQAIHKASTPEQRFSLNLDFLNSEKFRETDHYLQVLNETADLIFERMKTYESQSKLSEFMTRMGAILNSLNNRVKQEILFKTAPYFQHYFEEHQFTPEDLFLWWLKTGTYAMAQSILSKKIEFFLKNQEFDTVKKSVEIARTFLIRLPGEVVIQLLDKKIISKGVALLLVSSYSDIPEDIWRAVVLELWELRTTLSDDEGLLILEKLGDKLPDLRLDLLQAVLDKNKKNQIPWPEKVETFQNPSVEKRIKLLACRYSVQHGNYEEALKLSKTLPRLPENRTLYAMRLPIYFIQGQNFRVLHYFEKLRPIKDEFYEFFEGLSYTHTGKPKEGASILEKLVEAQFPNYLLLWKRLKDREEVVRRMVLEKLKSKKGAYYEVYRRIYLIQDDKEAALEKEKFILSEIADDFKVKNIKTEISDNRTVYEGIYGWVEASLEYKNAPSFRKVEACLQEMKNVFYDPLTEIYFGQLNLLNGKQSTSETIFQAVEQTCFQNENYSPLLTLLKVYQKSSLNSPLKKLTKNLLKKCKNSNICDDIYRFLAKTAVGDDKIELLNEIIEKTVNDEIETSLAHIQEAKIHPTEASLVPQLEKVFQNSTQFLNTDQSPLLETLGDQCFLHYRFTHSAEALNNAIHYFRKAYLFNSSRLELEIKILHTLWFRMLDDIFIQSDINFLSDDFSLPYWHAIALISESKKGVKFQESLNTNPDFKEIHILFEKILNKNKLWSAPPEFHELLSTDGLNWECPRIKKISSLNKVSFTNFWGLDSPTKILLENKRQTLLNSVEKSGSNYAKDGSPKNASNLVLEGETILFDWVSKNAPIKGNFEKLLERIEFSKSINPNLLCRKLILDIKIARLALTFDPNREWISGIPAAWVVAKFIKESQPSTNAEFQQILEEAKPLIEEIKPFNLQDLSILQAVDSAFYINNSQLVSQNKADLALILEDNPKKILVRTLLFEKKT